MSPGSTSASPFSTSTSRIRCIRLRSIMMPPSTGMTPPLRPLAPPRAVTASRSRAASRTTAATCSPEIGRTTTCGNERSM